MATYEELMNAARNAHSQGDTDAAARLVARAKQLSSENVVATAPNGGRFVRLSNGSVAFTSPNYSTSDPEAVKRLMEGEDVKKVVQSTTDQLTIGQAPAFARVQEFVRGAPFVGSYADETLSPQRRDNARAVSDAMRRENPGETAALNIGGAITGSIPMAAAAAGALPSAAVPSSRLGQGLLGLVGGATAGGLEGAVYGFGEGTDAASRMSEAGRQAGIGAAAGGVLGTVTPAASELVSSLIQRFKGSDVADIASKFGVSRETAKVLKQAFENNDTTAVDRILRAGDEATLADAGRSGMALLDAAANTGGRPLQIVDDAVGARAGRSLSVVNDTLDDALGPVTGPRQAARDVAQATAPARSAAYGAAYSSPIDYASDAGRKIEEVLGRIPGDTLARAVNEANEEMLSKGQRNLQILFDMDTGAFREMPNVQQIDEIKKALDAIARESQDQFGRLTQAGRRAATLAGELRDAAKDAVPAYGDALAIGRGKIELDDGLRLGLDMLKPGQTREMVAETLAGMSQDGKAMVRRGLRSYIDETLANVRPIASAPDSNEAREAMQAIRLLGSRSSKEKLRALLGADEFNRVWPQIEKVISSQEMVAAVATNSKTAVRQNVEGAVSDILEPGVVGTAARGKAVNTTERLVQELLNTTPGADAARREKIWAEIAQVLSERRGSKSAQAALQYIEKAISGQPLTEAQARLIAREAGVAGLLSGSRTTNQSLTTP